jgi:hypothetical protein
MSGKQQIATGKLNAAEAQQNELLLNPHREI